MMPGITGLAQINLPPDSDLDSVRRKLVLDLEYIATASLRLDAKIFFCTALKLVGIPGMRVARLIHLDRYPEIPSHFYPLVEEATEQTCPAPYDNSVENIPAADTAIPVRVRLAPRESGVSAAP